MSEIVVRVLSWVVWVVWAVGIGILVTVAGLAAYVMVSVVLSFF